MVGAWLSNRRRSAGREAEQLAFDRASTVQARLLGRIAPHEAARTINDLILAYWKFAETYYQRKGRPTEQLNHVRRAMRPLRKIYGSIAVAHPLLKLKAVRDVFVRGDLAYACPRAPRPQSSVFVNANVQRIKRMFEWDVENEVVPGIVF